MSLVTGEKLSSAQTKPMLMHSRTRLKMRSRTADDSALNGVKLYCRSSDGKVTCKITSSVGSFGSWKSPLDCVNGFMNGFRFRAEGAITGDDIMGMNMDSICQSGEVLEVPGTNKWGEWSSWTYCPPEAGVCGLQTRVHPSQGNLAWEDDAGLTDLKLLCCKS